MGRPLLVLDEKKIASLAFKGCNDSQIGTLMGCDEDTIKNRFSRLVRKSRAERRLELRKFQFKNCQEGNATMQIWLGKNELDQVDSHDITSNGQSISFNIVMDQKPDKPADETSDESSD